MMNRHLIAALRPIAAVLIALSFVAGCGGSGASSEPGVQVADDTVGTVALFFTDAPTDDYKQVLLSVTKATLIGGDDSQEVLFEGNREIDLLNLQNYSEPVAFGQVKRGTYTKIRLRIADLELVPHEGASIFPALPANGKIDLLEPDGFEVWPGRTVVIQIDIDAEKSLKIKEAGNSGKVKFRPVVFVSVTDGPPNKLARLEGAVSGEPGADSFVLCAIDMPDHCIDVATDTSTSFFDSAGLGTDFAGIVDGDMVVAIGEYSTDPLILNAVVVEIGGNAMQVKGEVISQPADSQFLLLTNENGDLVVEIQPGTKYYDIDGVIDPALVVIGADVEVEGVMPEKIDPDDPDLIRAALIVLLEKAADQRSGTIAAPLDSDTQTFVLSTADVGDINVCVVQEARILFVDTASSVVMAGAFGDLVAEQVVDVFGAMADDDSCFEASEVIVDVDASTPPE